MRAEGFVRFNQHHHTLLWKGLDAKNPGMGYGVEIAGTWYWYESWLLVVRNHLRREHRFIPEFQRQHRYSGKRGHTMPITLTINNQPVEVSPGDTVLDAINVSLTMSF